MNWNQPIGLQRLASTSWILCWMKLPPFLDKKFHDRSIRWLEVRFNSGKE